MDRIAQRLINAMLGKEDHRELEVYDITYSLQGVDSSNDAMLSFDGGRYETALSAPEGDCLDVTVTMGGVDITEACFENGTILIPEVTGAISITAGLSAVEEEEQPPVEDPVDTWEELQQARKERAQQLREQFSAAAADIGAAVEETAAAASGIYDTVAAVVEATETAVNEISARVQEVVEWVTPLIRFLEQMG